VKRSQDFRQVRKVIDVVLKLGPTCALRLLNFFDNEDVWTHNKELWVRREEPRLCNFTHNHKTWIHHIAHILNWKEARMTIRLKRDSNMLCVPDVIRIRNIWLQIEGKTWLRNTSYSDSSQLAQSWEDYTSKEKKKREKKIKCAGLFWLSTSWEGACHIRKPRPIWVPTSPQSKTRVIEKTAFGIIVLQSLLSRSLERIAIGISIRSIIKRQDQNSQESQSSASIGTKFRCKRAKSPCLLSSTSAASPPMEPSYILSSIHLSFPPISNCNAKTKRKKKASHHVKRRLVQFSKDSRTDLSTQKSKVWHVLWYLFH